MRVINRFCTEVEHNGQRKPSGNFLPTRAILSCMLLGNPGEGKTTVFEKEGEKPGTRYVTARNWFRNLFWSSGSAPIIPSRRQAENGPAVPMNWKTDFVPGCQWMKQENIGLCCGGRQTCRITVMPFFGLPGGPFIQGTCPGRKLPDQCILESPG